MSSLELEIIQAAKDVIRTGVNNFEADNVQRFTYERLAALIAKQEMGDN